VRSVAATAAWRLLPLVVGAAVGRGVGDGAGPLVYLRQTIL
jgi:hypothetical protein